MIDFWGKKPQYYIEHLWADEQTTLLSYEEKEVGSNKDGSFQVVPEILPRKYPSTFDHEGSLTV